MVYNPATDFLGLWRNIAGQVSKTEMPGLDYTVAALARAGLITLSVSATAPVVNQSVTAWLRAAVPSYSAEGTLFLWDPAAAAYAAATPALLYKMLQTAAGQNGINWWFTTGGPPLNTVGNNGDLAIRTDEPGGIFGPKILGAWPANPIPGTTDIISSAQLDLTFGDDPGQIIYRGPAVWQTLPIGDAGTVMVSSGAVPEWEIVSVLLDAVFGNVQGSILYRDVGSWNDLPPGVANQVLATAGPGANPLWAPRSAEFDAGTAIVFRQSAAPTGWTKQTAINDYGLRVTSGAVGTVAGTAFSTVFAQTVVGSTTISVATMPSHTHPFSAITQSGANDVAGGATTNHNSQSTNTDAQGGGGSHSHSVQLSLSYIDVIIAVKN